MEHNTINEAPLTSHRRLRKYLFVPYGVCINLDQSDGKWHVILRILMNDQNLKTWYCLLNSLSIFLRSAECFFCLGKFARRVRKCAATVFPWAFDLFQNNASHCHCNQCTTSFLITKNDTICLEVPNIKTLKQSFHTAWLNKKHQRLIEILGKRGNNNYCGLACLKAAQFFQKKISVSFYQD